MRPSSVQAHLQVRWTGRMLTLTASHTVRIEKVLSRGALVEVPVAAGSVLEADHGGVDCLCDLGLTREDQVHELTVVTLDRTLACGEVVGFGPSQAKPYPELADLGIFVHRAGIAGHIEARHAR